MSLLDNKLSYKIFYPLFFISGVSSLTYELIWIRIFIPIFGIGIYSISAVVSSFMAGLALGSYICGKVIDYKKNLLRYYAFFVLLIGAYAVILPLLININRATMPFFYNNISSNFHIFSIFRFVFAFVLLIIPCSLIGATLPLMSRFLIISSQGNVKKHFGFLYALNTFGAVCGCILAAFFMLEHFGIIFSTYLVAITNILIAVFVYLHSLSYRFDYSSLSQASPATSVKYSLSKYAKNILFVAFLSGFCVLSFEILLARVLIGILPNDVYLFPSILITMLVAISLGSFLNFAWFVKFKNYSFVLGTSMIAGGFILAAALRYLPFQPQTLEWSAWALCLTMVFPASLFIGIAFPNLLALYSSGNQSIGHDVGSIYSINTWGAVLGSFLTAFIFIPLLGLRNTFFLCTALYILIGEFIFIAIFRKIKRAPILIFCTVLITIMLLKQLIPVNLFRDIFLKNIRDSGEMVFYKEGIVSSVGVFKREGFFNIQYSDRTNIGAEVSQTGSTRNNHRLKAHIPMIFNENPRRVINIGFGTGISAYSLTVHNNIERIDNVEICRETFAATKFFINNLDNIFNNPETKLIVDDGRNYLFVTTRKYDVILVYPFFPFQGENIFFYTKDFLELCKSRLKPGGLISVWFPFNLKEDDGSLILLKTFLEVFPRAALFSTSPEPSSALGDREFLVGSIAKEGINLSPVYLEKRFRSLSPEVRIELAQANINNAQDISRYLIVDQAGLTELCSSVKVTVTDKRTILDYQAARKAWFAHLDSAHPKQINAAFTEGSFKKAIEFNPKDDMAYVELGRLYAMQGKHTEAEQAFKKALEFNPYNDQAYVELSSLYAMQGKPSETEQVLQKALELKPRNDQAYVELGRLYTRQLKHSQAEESFKNALKLNPHNDLAYVGLGRLYTKQGKHSQAEEVYQNALKLNRQSSWLYVGLGSLYAMQGKHTEAEEVFKKALELNPYNDQVYVELGRLYAMQGKHAEAEEAFKKALELNPYNDQAYVGLGILTRQLKHSQAEEVFKNALKFNPYNDLAYVELGRLYTKQGKHSQAEQAFQKSLELNSHNDQAYAELGWLYTRQRKHSQAEQALQKALELNPQSCQAYLELGRIYTRQRKHIEAEELFRKALESNPQNSWLYVGLGRLYTMQGKHTEAKEAFKKALELNPYNDQVYVELGALYTRQGKLSQVEQALQKALELNSHNDQAYVRLGSLYTIQRKHSQAEQALQKALELNPQNYQACVELSRLYTSQGKLGETEQVLQKALKLNSKDDQTYVELGRLYLTQRKHSQVEQALQKALELNPYNDQAYIGLGSLYTRQGEHSQAEQALQKALELNPESVRLYMEDWQ